MYASKNGVPAPWRAMHATWMWCIASTIAELPQPCASAAH